MNQNPDDLILDVLPDQVVATMESRDRWAKSLRQDHDDLEFLLADLQSWTPGQHVRVAFRGGDDHLYAAIESATQEISEAANLTLDFRQDGAYRTWSTEDVEYAGEIRVSFDQEGFFSLIGTDSVNPAIGSPRQLIGGRPYQISLNLGGFTDALPTHWEGTVRHEFLHAVAFQHEHQNMRGPCENEFRWDDDPGYQPTQNANGVFLPDANGKRPGVYTFLGGAPNFWSRAKVDHNLRGVEKPAATVAGPADTASVMLYRFAPMFFHTDPSPCAPSSDGQHLSDGDKRGLHLLYPKQVQDVGPIDARRKPLIEAIEQSLTSTGGRESFTANPLADHALAHLRTLPTSPGDHPYP
jgi:hypothetical protein